MRKPFGIIADDLTGANDTGAQFSRRGAKVLVFLSLERIPSKIDGDWDAIVINAGSRNLAPAASRARMEEAISCMESLGCEFAYHKVDSTLRGNWSVELELALSRREGMAILAPAFPLNGRTVEGGELKVRGVPLHLTEAALDSLSPVRGSGIEALLGESLARQSRRLGFTKLSQGVEAVRSALLKAREEGARILICDTREQADLRTIAEAAWPEHSRALLCGSAGLARELGALLEFTRSRRPDGIPKSRPPVLVIAGSRSEVTAEQVRRLREARSPATGEIDPGSVDDPWNGRKESETAQGLVAKLKGMNNSGSWVVTIGERSPTEEAHFPVRSARLNGLLGELALEALRARAVGALILTGGDVAASVLESLEALGVCLGEEILPGIPLGQVVGGPYEGLAVVTKAGAFGAPDALIDAVSFLQHMERARPIRTDQEGKAME